MYMRSVEWCHRRNLTTAEREILFAAANDVPRDEIARLRDVKPSTLKKQVQWICAKTGARSLDHAVLLLAVDMLRELGCPPFGDPVLGPTDEDELETALEAGEPVDG